MIMRPHMITTYCVRILLVGGLWLLPSAGPAAGQTIPLVYLPLISAPLAVTSTEDELNADGDCSLREAIMAANTDTTIDRCLAGPGVNTLVVPVGLYTLGLAGAHEDSTATGDLDITDDL